MNKETEYEKEYERRRRRDEEEKQKRDEARRQQDDFANLAVNVAMMVAIFG